MKYQGFFFFLGNWSFYFYEVSWPCVIHSYHGVDAILFDTQTCTHTVKNFYFLSFKCSRTWSFACISNIPFLLPVWREWEGGWFYACEYDIDAGLCIEVFLVGSWILEHHGYCTWPRYKYALLFVFYMLLFLLVFCWYEIRKHGEYTEWLVHLIMQRYLLV